MRALTREEITAAIEHSERCVDCGTSLEAITRLSVVELAGPPIAPFCKACADERAPGIKWVEAPCEHCARPVRRPHDKGRFFCSTYCHRALRLSDRRESRQCSLLSPIECAGCSEPLHPKRPNQKTHSPKCRQAKKRREEARRAEEAKESPKLAPLCTCGGRFVDHLSDGSIQCLTCSKWKVPPSSPVSRDLLDSVERERSRYAAQRGLKAA